jgi:phosphate transport system substrate-binding protein
MKSHRRIVGVIALLLLSMLPTALQAQETPVSAVGSGIAAPLFEAIIAASGIETTVETTITGTHLGLEQFCQNQAPVALANRGMTDAEASACSANGVEFIELLLADDAFVLITNNADTFTTCLSQSELTLAFAPSAQGQITNWRGLNAANPDLNLSIIVPPNDTSAYALLDSLVEGDGLRSDRVSLANDAAIIEAVASTRGALGVVSYVSAAAAEQQVRILELSNEQNVCIPATPTTIETGQYRASQRLLAYVNRVSLSNLQLEPALSFLGSSSAEPVIQGLGFIAPNETLRAQNASAVENAVLGRTFSIPPVEFTIQPGVVGTLTVGGDTAGYNYLQDITTAFNQRYQGVTSTLDFEGRVAGARRFCNGELDIITLTQPLTDDQLANCAANNIVPVGFDLGTQAVVLLVGSADANQALFCLRTDQIGQIWSARAESLPTNWSAIDPGFPDLPTTLLVPTSFSSSADLLLSKSTGISAALRADIRTEGDPLYRAASVAVVDGAMTFMTWGEYLRVLQNEQFGIRLVRVDAGNGCILPDINSITDGSYPLTRQVQIVFSQRALSRPDVQSLAWYIFSDENFNRLALNELYGIELSALPRIRETLQAQFNAASEAAATPEPTPAPEATPAG